MTTRKPDKPTEIHEKIARLETDVSIIGDNQQQLSKRFDGMEDRLNDVQASMKTMSEGISRSFAKLDERMAVDAARRLPPIPTILGTIATTFVIASMTVAGLFFLIDARVSSAVNESSQWTREWKDNGKLYNQFADITHRLENLEKRPTSK